MRPFLTVESHIFCLLAFTGSRPGHSTVHQLFALQHCIDKTRRAKQPFFACFLDLKGAHDRVQRPMLWHLLQRLRIQSGMLAAIKSSS